jgi:cytochrome P450
MTVHAELDFGLTSEIPDLHGVLAELRREAPVVEVGSGPTHAFVVLTHEHLRAALRDEESFPSEASYSEIMDPAVGRSLNSMSGDEHHRNRAIVSPSFRRQQMTAHRGDLLEPACHALLDRIEGRREVDLRAAYTHLFPMMVITTLIGMPWHEYATLERWTNALFAYPVDPEGALAAKAELSDFLLGLMKARREAPGDDLVTTLVTGEFHDRRLTDEEILSFLRLLFPAGTHNTTNGISSMFFALLADRAGYERVREQPACRRAAAEEALRWEPPVSNLPRRACRAGTELGGVEIPPNAPMVYSFAAANRDPSVFPDPDRYDIDRNTGDTLTFGLGEHFCLGAWLAREEMVVALDVLLQRTKHVQLADVDAAQPRGVTLRGPSALPVTIEW